jgi:hypothetical protein
MFRAAIILFTTCLILFSCEHNESQNSSLLHFSDDTIYFDTVFSSIGSVTKELRIVNQGSKGITINRIFLSGGQSSMFRLNIDGEPVNEKFNIPIEAGDSIFIFVDVTVDPADSESPVSVSDSILFQLNDQIQIVQLLAWGQDIILIDNKTINSQTWHKGKPYVIYNKVIVDTLETLTIESGSKVYFHRNASMVVAGTIIADGSADQPVLFAGDRLENMYMDVPGQWKGILILNSAKGNNFSHAIIRNGLYGIQLGEAISSLEIPSLKIYSSEVSHISVSGLSSVNGDIEAANCLLYHCGNYCVYLGSGGEYQFIGCTIYDRWEYGLKLSPAIYINEKGENPEVITGPMHVDMINCVIWGDNQSEMSISSAEKIFTGSYSFDHCLVKLDTITAKFWNKDDFPSTIVNKDPRFIDASAWDLRPDTLSPLVNRGSKLMVNSFPVDIRGVPRNLYGDPDIGAYERKPGEKKRVK